MQGVVTFFHRTMLAYPTSKNKKRMSHTESQEYFVKKL